MNNRVDYRGLNFAVWLVRIEYRNGKWVTLCGIEMALPEGENQGD